MSDIVRRIDTMIDGLAARLGISVTDMADLFSDAKDEILRLQSGLVEAPDCVGGDNSLSIILPTYMHKSNEGTGDE